MYAGQIFALLGPNGAGKTTTLSMLTGLLPATSGEATVNDIMIFEEMSKVREMLGVCPQHDVLFEELTPEEHLRIFAAFKGRQGSATIEHSVAQLLQDVELNDSKDVLAENLSGGQRRKLSIAIAFVGDSPIIFLDEPTSGMDMRARQGVWEILKKYKKDKVTILTTHYMEEAEVLGDRIGIMTLGSLKCVGSPFFLKNRFGVGHNITMVMGENANKEAIRQVVVGHFPETRMREASKELTFHVPKSAHNDFKKFFVELDDSLPRLHIESYGMSSSTLEEVFLRVARDEGLDDPDSPEEAAKEPRPQRSESLPASGPLAALDAYSIAEQPDPAWCHGFCVHLNAILVKRLLITVRNWLTLLIELVVPAALIIFGFGMTAVPTFFDGPVRWFYIGAYQTPQSVVINQNGLTGVSYNDLISNFESGMVPEPATVSTGNDNSVLAEIDSKIFEGRGRKPSRYGSIYAKSVDLTNQIYEFTIFANISSQDSAGAFMGIFAQTILRTALQKPGLRVAFANAPLPLPYATRNQEEAKNGGLVSSALVVAFALVPASIISFIVKEREDNLKHQQLISGVSMLAYWLSNAVADLLKCLIPCALAIALLPAFNVELPKGWLVILLYGLSIIPFTYTTSFFFVSENVAQITTLMGHFFLGVVLGQVFLIFRIFDSTRAAGNALAWIFRLVPSFSLSYGISNIAK